MQVSKKSYAIFSLGDRHGTSSSNSSSLSSPSSAMSWGMFIVELEIISGTGRMLGRREFLRWLIISGLKRFGFSPRGISRWFPVIDTSIVVEPGEDSFKHCRESLRPVASGKIAAKNKKKTKILEFFTKNLIHKFLLFVCATFKATILLSCQHWWFYLETIWIK